MLNLLINGITLTKKHNNQSPHDFEFLPTKQPGVADHINETFEPLHCFTELFSAEILQK